MKLVDLLDSEFLEDHEREELKRLLKHKPERMKWLRKLLTRGPLQNFWRVAGWATFANIFLFLALLFSGYADWWRDDLSILMVVYMVAFVITGFMWALDEETRKSDEKRKKAREEEQHGEGYCRFHKTYH